MIASQVCESDCGLNVNDMNNHTVCSLRTGYVSRVDVEWSRGRLFDRDIGLLFQRIVAEARALRCTEVSVKEERRHRPNGESLEGGVPLLAALGGVKHHLLFLPSISTTVVDESL